MIELAAAIRFVHLAAVVFLVGSLSFVALVARPACASATACVAAPVFFQAEADRRTLRWSLVAIFASALAGLALQSVVVSEMGAGVSVAGGDGRWLHTLVPLLRETQYGMVWTLRFALAVVLAALLFSKRNELGVSSGRSRPPWRQASACSHRSPCTGTPLLAKPGNWCCRFAPMGCICWPRESGWVVWCRCFSCLRLGNRSAGAAAHEVIRGVTWRYSRMAMACVSVLLLTGAVNAWVLVGGVPALLGTPYGRLLLLKLVLLLPLLGIAAFNLLRLNPRIASATSLPPGGLQVLSGRLARNALIEAALGILVLAIVALLGTTPPARHVEPDWPFSFRWDWSVLDAAPRARAEIEIGLAWLVLGFFVLQFVFLTRRLRIVSAVAGIALIIYAGIVILLQVSTEAYPTSYRRPAVSYQAISVANGKKLYAANCVACHGATGHGDGPAAGGMLQRPPDLTGSRATARTPGDLFWLLSKGVGGSAMPGFGTTLSEEDHWDLINFLRALAGGWKARSLAPVIEDLPWLVAPDFVFPGASGTYRSLKDFRGEKPVLLLLAGASDVTARLRQLGESKAQLFEAGIEIVAVPGEPQEIPGGNASTQIVTEGNAEIHQTYALFAGSVTRQAPGAASLRAEYLIDRQGYIRARWLPDEGNAWLNPEAILRQVELLRNEKSRAPFPEEHLH